MLLEPPKYSNNGLRKVHKQWQQPSKEGKAQSHRIRQPHQQLYPHWTFPVVGSILTPKMPLRPVEVRQV